MAPQLDRAEPPRDVHGLHHRQVHAYWAWHPAKHSTSRAICRSLHRLLGRRALKSAECADDNRCATYERDGHHLGWNTSLVRSHVTLSLHAIDTVQ